MEWIALCIILINSTFSEGVSMSNSISEDFAVGLVEEYNADLKEVYGETIPEIKKGFTSTGTLEIMSGFNEAKEEGIIVARFKEDSEQNKRVLTFKLIAKENKGLPNEIKDARIIFIGNQLIIDDINSGMQVNFYLSASKASNKTPFIETIPTKVITIRKPNMVEINI